MTQPHLVIVPHSHWDREWYRPFEEFRHRLVRMLDSLVDIMEEDPEFKYFHMDGQTIVLEDYKEIVSDAQHARLAQLVRDGRIQVGPWYILPDEFLVTGESHIRNLERGTRIAREYGDRLPVGYLPDQFGHIAQMPQILRHAGLEAAAIWRGVGDDVGQTQFLWQAPDGSEVFTVYLAASYSNGAHLPNDEDAFKLRMQMVANMQMGRYANIPTRLIMNGSDHLFPQPFVPGVVKKINENGAGFTAEMGCLPLYLERAQKETDPDSLVVHVGEFRSPRRAHLLPGVTSARQWQKQRDYEISAQLERYAEPLVSWSMAHGGPDRRGFLDYAWKLLLQNHPHDSICGCSVDSVHDEMDTRYDKIGQVCERLMTEASEVLGKALPSANGGATPSVFVYDSTGGDGSIVLEQDVEWPGLSKKHVLRDDAGHEYGIDMGKPVAGGEQVFGMKIPAAALSQAAGVLEGGEFGGFYPIAMRTRFHDATCDLMLEVGTKPADFNISAQLKRLEKKIADKKIAMLDITATRTPCVPIRAVVPAPGAPGLRSFALTKSSVKGAPTPKLTATDTSIANDAYDVRVESEGTLAIHDKELNTTLTGVLAFEDVADRGDEYNFDPLENDAPVTTPEKWRVVKTSAGKASATMTLEHAFTIPAALDKSRQSRTRKTVRLKLRTEVTVYPGVKRVDFTTSFDNTACDHRLRVRVPVPFHANAVDVEQAFGVVTRPVDVEPQLEKGPESPVGQSPQKTFASVCDGRCGVTLMNRGVPEVEVVRDGGGSAFALTLVRAVGWLSRGDMVWRKNHAGPPMATPGAQGPGSHTRQFALTTHAGSWRDAGVPRRAHHYAFPPFAFMGAGARSGGGASLEIDNPDVVMSAFHPAPDDAHAAVVRLYNATPVDQTAHIRMNPAVGPLVETNAFGEEGAGTAGALTAAHDAGAGTLTLRPCQIVTLRVPMAAS